MKTIVVGYDESDPSHRALERAATLATAYDARLIVTSVARATEEKRRTVAPPPRDYAEDLAHARAYLEDRGVRASYVAAEGEPARMIATVAEQHGADLIVVGTREAGLVERVQEPS